MSFTLIFRQLSLIRHNVEYTAIGRNAFVLGDYIIYHRQNTNQIVRLSLFDAVDDDEFYIDELVNSPGDDDHEVKDLLVSFGHSVYLQ